MQAPRAAAMQPGMAFLDTSLGQKGHDVVTGLPTPISAFEEEAKPHLSSLSFSQTGPDSLPVFSTLLSPLHENPKPHLSSLSWPTPYHASSQSSSSSSFASVTEPSTPEQDSSSASFSFLTDSSFSRLPTSQTPTTQGSCYHPHTPVQSSPGLIYTHNTPLDVHDSQEWVYVPQVNEQRLPSMQRHDLDCFLPVGSDLSTSMAASVLSSTGSFQSAGSFQTNHSTWSTGTDLSPTSFTQRQRGTDCDTPRHSLLDERQWTLPLRPSLTGSYSMPAPTIVPSDAMPSPLYCGDLELNDYDSGRLSWSSHFDEVSISPASAKDAQSECIKDEHEGFHMVKSSHFKTATGRIFKQGRKTQFTLDPQQRRRHNRRGQKTVDSETGIHCEPKGQYRCEGHAKIRCGKTFVRPEHLKRHQITHNPSDAPMIPCPLPLEYQCSRRATGKDKGLNRMDNWRAHLFTHLRGSANQRNAHCTREVMYQVLRENDPGDGAEKTIEILEREWARWVQKREEEAQAKLLKGDEQQSSRAGKKQGRAI